jgi:hypothetical protein
MYKDRNNVEVGNEETDADIFEAMSDLQTPT